ncbi:DUF1697 domain-containing protein [Georgenia alba]|uniref:DUF1697 domain-containing protein n=1 Tax=Georgenia alba TaxID=2233858 RepID=A0ABW2Q2D2_9MICO
MTSYCALLRGIGPTNPNMRNEKLRGVLERLGFEGVASVISSGNVVFSTDAQDAAALEDRIQAALRADLGIPGGTIVRSRAELQELVDRAPFGDLPHSRETYLTVTFLKRPLDDPGTVPDPGFEGVRVIGYDAGARAILTVTDTTATGSPDYMVWLERTLGKDMTTRTWLTVNRILTRMTKTA